MSVRFPGFEFEILGLRRAQREEVLEYNWEREKSLLYGGVLDEAFKETDVS